MNQSSFILLALLLCAPAVLLGQKNTEKDFAAGNKVYTLLSDYLANMDFKENALSKGYDEKNIDAFKELFTANAKILDEANPPVDFCIKDSIDIYVSISEYITKLSANYPTGISSKATKISIDFKKLSQLKAFIVMEKVIKGDYRGDHVEIKDTLLLSLVFTEDYKECKIDGIKKLGRSWRCINCKPCPVQKEPEAKTDVGVDLTVNIGAPLNTMSVNIQSTDAFNHGENIASEGRIKGLKAKPVGAGVNASLELDIYFTHKRNIGLGVGLYYTLATTTVNIDTLHLLYGSKNSNDMRFVRILTARDVTEKVMSQNFGIPLLFKANVEVSKKMDFFFHVGPIITFANTQTTSYTAVVDKEANYQIRGEQFTYDDKHIYENTDLLYTKGMVLNHANGDYERVTDYFNRNTTYYNVFIDKNINGKEVFNYTVGYGALLRTGISLKVSELFAFNIGATFSALKVQGNNKKGRALEDDYKSVFYAVNSYNSYSYFLNLGLKFKLK
jgi:hypothetical protein